MTSQSNSVEEKNLSCVMDTLNILSAGPKIYARKRKRKSQQVKEIVFDEQARR